MVFNFPEEISIPDVGRNRFEGRGIVVWAHRPKALVSAYVLIRLLRDQGCALPIQLWHRGTNEFVDFILSAVVQFDAQPMNAGEIISRRALQAHSLLKSPFREVLGIDATNVTVRNPEYLFDAKEYALTGAVFWPGFGATSPKSPVWDAMGVPYRCEPKIDAAQMIIEKEVCWDPLSLAFWLSQDISPFTVILETRNDIFRFAWHRYGSVFAMPRFDIEHLPLPGACCSYLSCQHDFDGERIFQQRDRFVWRIAGGNPMIPGFFHEAQCRVLVEDLKQLASNARRGNRKESPEILRLTEQLLKNRWLVPDGAVDLSADLGIGEAVQPANRRLKQSDPSSIARDRHLPQFSFCKDGTFGVTSTPKFSFWKISSDGTGPILEISSENGEQRTFLCFGHGEHTPCDRLVERESHKTVLATIEASYPGSSSSVAPLRKKSIAGQIRDNWGDTLHMCNSSLGLGDHITSLYACCAVAELGIPVVFYTRYYRWFTRISHPGLTIAAELTPLAPEPFRKEEMVNLFTDHSAQIRYAYSRARWYCSLINPCLQPCRPQQIDRGIAVERFDFKNYVLFAPCSGAMSRDWPSTHWSRLALLFREAGIEVVMVGTEEQEPVLSRICEGTAAYWVVNHSPEWVTDALLGAKVLISNDSGLAHVGGLLESSTVAIHAQFSAEMLWAGTKVTSITPATKCRFCRYLPENGFRLPCLRGCSALASIGVETVFDGALALIQHGGT